MDLDLRPNAEKKNIHRASLLPLGSGGAFTARARVSGSVVVHADAVDVLFSGAQILVYSVSMVSLEQITWTVLRERKLGALCQQSHNHLQYISSEHNFAIANR